VRVRPILQGGVGVLRRRRLSTLDRLEVVDQPGGCPRISGSEHPCERQRALAHGAVGFLRKSLQPSAMQRALQRLLEGEEIGELPDDGVAPPAGPRLTPRQREVLRSLARGASNKQMAQQFSLSEGTVKLHVAAILQALDAGNRTEAAARARALGLD
jgi:DNA-binding NarL/FixJ family response regulator